ncbi:hypothetical protein WH47_02052 [Habropoda laboriosa]|uniref:Uncharacterized protein n=1 Tax=Habropoda laboriosa TaxID=597456 RepID=A0A0L7QZM9_9HYME|nr:hypothetical protein WH47_02052 [Habropoda laboriosa]
MEPLMRIYSPPETVNNSALMRDKAAVETANGKRDLKSTPAEFFENPPDILQVGNFIYPREATPWGWVKDYQQRHLIAARVNQLAGRVGTKARKKNRPILRPTSYASSGGLFIRHNTDRENPRSGTTNLFTSGLSPNGSTNGRYMSSNGIPPLYTRAAMAHEINMFPPVTPGEPVKRGGKLVAPSRRPTINLDSEALICLGSPYGSAKCSARRV